MDLINDVLTGINNNLPLTDSLNSEMNYLDNINYYQDTDCELCTRNSRHYVCVDCFDPLEHFNYRP